MGLIFKHRSIFLSFALRCILLIVFYLPGFNIKTFARPTPSNAGAITKFPFLLLDGGIIIIKATIGNFPDSLNFVLDTGCEGISLDSSTVEELKLTSTASLTTIKGIAQFKQARFVYHQPFHLPNLTIDSFEYHVNDYRFLKDAYGIKVDGVVGYSFLKKFIVKVNYDKRMLEVWNHSAINYPKSGSVITLGNQRLPFLSAHFKDKTAIANSYIFDTGADVCLMLSDSFVADSNFLRSDRKKIEIQAAGPGGTQTMQFIAMPEVRIGKFTFKNVPALVFKDEYNVTLYPNTGGIIGNELLHRFNLIINYAEGKIHLSPNSYFNDPFRYNYNGFEIIDINGQPTIAGVKMNSLAEKAGLKTGDVVFGINDNFSNNADDLNKIISSTRNELKIVVIRNKQLKKIVVAIESIL